MPGKAEASVAAKRDGVFCQARKGPPAFAQGRSKGLGRGCGDAFRRIPPGWNSCPLRDGTPVHLRAGILSPSARDALHHASKIL